MHVCMHSQWNPWLKSSLIQRFFEGIHNPQNRYLSVSFLFFLFLNDTQISLKFLSDFATRLAYWPNSEWLLLESL